MRQEFFTVENTVIGRRARVPKSRLAHLNDDWKVVEDDPAPRPKKAAKRAESAPQSPSPLDPPEPGQPDTDSPTDPAPKEF